MSCDDMLCYFKSSQTGLAHPSRAARTHVWELLQHVEVGLVHALVVPIRVLQRAEERPLPLAAAVVVHHVIRSAYSTRHGIDLLWHDTKKRREIMAVHDKF